MSRDQWNDWTDEVLPANETTVAGWRARNFGALLDASPSLEATDLEDVPHQGKRILAWLAGTDLDTLQGVAEIIEAASSARPSSQLHLTPSQWQHFSAALHGAAHLLGRFAAGTADAADPMDQQAALMLHGVLRDWEELVEEQRPKTAPADLHGPR